MPFHSSIISRIRQFDRNIPRGKIQAKALGLLGTARLLAAQKDRWRGTVVFVAQPAEETLDGVKAMLADGLFKKVPRPNYCLALHCIGDLATGEVGITPGPALASVQVLEVTVRGKGGHGSRPHEAKDPIVVAAQIILACVVWPTSRDPAGPLGWLG